MNSGDALQCSFCRKIETGKYRRRRRRRKRRRIRKRRRRRGRAGYPAWR